MGVALLLLYLPTLAPGATFSDGPEIVTAVVTLGVIHPTGYPLFTMLAHAFTRLLALPIEECVKVELFNALCAAIATVLTARSAREVARATAAAPLTHEQVRAADLAGLLAGVVLGVCPLLWAQVRIAEVYPFHVLLVTWGGYSWLRFVTTRKSRYVLAAALAMGMGLAHHVTMVYMLPAGAILLLATRPSIFVSWFVYPPVWLARKVKRTFAARLELKHPWLLPVACVVGLLPLLSYAYLLWANEHTAGVNWGGVENWDTLYNHATGAQYRRFMETKELAWYLARAKKVPDAFDQQFLPPGTVTFFIGIAVTVHRAWRYALFLLAYMLFNVGHGVYYSVGDFLTYFLPGVYCCSVIIGVGAYWLLIFLRQQPASARLWMCLSAAGVMLATTALSLWGYARFSKRVPAAFRELALGGGSTVLGIAAVVVLALTIAALSGKLTIRRRLGADALPRVAMSVAALGLALTVFARGYEYATAKIVGKSYAAELSALIPPGSILLTQGDGFLFSMWHEQHVLGRGRDFATVDLGNIRTSWYEHYLYARHPRDCDPIWGKHARDPSSYEEHCGDYRRRIDLKQKKSWVGMALSRSRAPRDAKRVPGEIIRGADPRCHTDEQFAKDHANKECRCKDYDSKPGELRENCVYSHEEQGIVARADNEIRALRLIEDFIDERPIFERNALMFWIKDPKHNYRGWNGPTFQRLSALYTYVNRGRFNQIAYAADVARTKPCAAEYDRIELRKHTRPPRVRQRYPLRKAYQPNPNPILISASFLTSDADGNDDDATRFFAAGDTVHVHIHWFERHIWDSGKPDRRGDKLRHGVRLCLYDPSGAKIASASTVSGDRAPWPSFPLSSQTPAGTYRLQGCSVGDVGDREAPLPHELPCTQLLLDYHFELLPGSARD